MIECKKCGSFNLRGTKYCQKCGQYLENQSKKGFLKSLSWKNIAGIGGRGISIAPLCLTLMEGNGVFTEESKIYIYLFRLWETYLTYLAIIPM